MQDEYLVYIREDGTRFFYKNKKLHREEGPAIVAPKDIEQHTNLSDEDLYIKVYKPEDVSPKIMKDRRVRTPKQIRGIPKPLIYAEVNTLYWLEGCLYKKQQFNSIILNEKLKKELVINQDKSKKMKI